MPARRPGRSLLRAARFGAALALAGTATDAIALSLGESAVRSSLGEPLQVELQIESDPQLGGLPVARLLNADGSEAVTIRGAGVGNIRLEIEAIDDVRQRLRIRSTQPVWEPLLNLRVEVSQASMRIVRDLPVLIDPPSLDEPARETRVAEAIDTPAAEPLPATAPTATAAAVTGTPPSAPKRRSPKPATPAPQPQIETAAEPLRRFTLSATLSPESLAWLEIHPSPRAAEAPAPTELADADAAEQRPIRAAATGVAQALTVVPSASASMPLSERMDARLRSADLETVSAAERGLPMGSPWRVFAFMAALSTLLFAWARRMRKRMTLQPPSLAI